MRIRYIMPMKQQSFYSDMIDKARIALWSKALTYLLLYNWIIDLLFSIDIMLFVCALSWIWSGPVTH